MPYRVGPPSLYQAPFENNPDPLILDEERTQSHPLRVLLSVRYPPKSSPLWMRKNRCLRCPPNCSPLWMRKNRCSKGLGARFLGKFDQREVC